MKGYAKWGGLPEFLVRSFQLHLQGCTVFIATGLKLEEFPEEAHPSVKLWDAVGRITHSVPSESSFCLGRSWARCPAGQPSPPPDNSVRQQSHPPSEQNLPPEQRNFLYTTKDFPGSKRPLNIAQLCYLGAKNLCHVPAELPRNSWMLLLLFCFSVWLQLFLHHFSLFPCCFLLGGDCSRAAGPNINQWPEQKTGSEPTGSS